LRLCGKRTKLLDPKEFFQRFCKEGAEKPDMFHVNRRGCISAGIWHRLPLSVSFRIQNPRLELSHAYYRLKKQKVRGDPIRSKHVGYTDKQLYWIQAITTRNKRVRKHLVLLYKKSLRLPSQKLLGKNEYSPCSKVK
jgi:hypothetical protein